MGPPWQVGHTPSLAIRSHRVSVRLEVLPKVSLMSGVAGILKPCHAGEKAGSGHSAGV